MVVSPSAERAAALPPEGLEGLETVETPETEATQGKATEKATEKSTEEKATEEKTTETGQNPQNPQNPRIAEEANQNSSLGARSSVEAAFGQAGTQQATRATTGATGAVFSPSLASTPTASVSRVSAPTEGSVEGTVEGFVEAPTEARTEALSGAPDEALNGAVGESLDESLNQGGEQQATPTDSTGNAVSTDSAISESQVVAFPARPSLDPSQPQDGQEKTEKETENEKAERENTESEKTQKTAKPRLTKIQSKDALRGIREAAQEIGVEPHVLRFWETRFSALKPIKQAGGRRLYRPQDMELLRRIYALLREDGMTIKGAAKVIGNRAGRAEAKNDSLRIRANEILKIADELEALFK